MSACLWPKGSAFTPDVAVEGLVYDHNRTSLDNYQNGDLLIMIRAASIEFRSVGDPAYGVSITLTKPITGWSETITQPSGGFIDNYGKVTSWTTTFDNFAGTGAAAIATIWVPTSPAGLVRIGSSITIFIDVPSVAQDVTAISYWENGDIINIVILGRDSVTKTGYDGAYLLGVEVDSTLTIQATVLDPDTKLEAESLTQKDKAMIRGFVSEPGATVNVYNYFSNTPIGSTIADNTTGDFEITINLTRGTDHYITNHIFIEGVDNAGNSTGKIFLRPITVSPAPSVSNWPIIVGTAAALIVVAGICLFLLKRRIR